jgi:hypothetical protein
VLCNEDRCCAVAVAVAVADAHSASAFLASMELNLWGAAGTGRRDRPHRIQPDRYLHRFLRIEEVH